MTDPRPAPRYGEYADLPPVVVPPPEPVAVAERPRRTTDIVLTTVLLLYGVFDVVTAFGRFVELPATMREVYAQQGIGVFAADDLAITVGLACNIVRVALLVIAIVGSLLLVSRGRRAFWVPLAAGVLAALVVGALILVVVLTDPTFTAYVTQQTGQ